MKQWEDTHNASAYDRYAATHPIFRETSRDLVALCGLDRARLIVDLACGTGVTTEAILAEAGDAARIVAIDSSGAMLAIARKRLERRPVEWICASAVEIAQHVTSADAVVCNSAIWYFDLIRTLAAAHATLKNRGVFVFNVIAPLVVQDRSEDGGRPEARSLLAEIRTVAAELGFRFARPGSRTAPEWPTTLNDLERRIDEAGFELEAVQWLEYPNRTEAVMDWFRVPVFADLALPGMAYTEQIRAIDAACERFGRRPLPASRWTALRVRKKQ